MFLNLYAIVLYFIVMYCIVSAIYDASHFNPRIWALPTPLPSDRIDNRHQTVTTLTYYLILSMRISLPRTLTLLLITAIPYYPKSPFPQMQQRQGLLRWRKARTCVRPTNRHMHCETTHYESKVLSWSLHQIRLSLPW